MVSAEAISGDPLDIGKIFGAIMIPAVLLVLTGIFATVVGAIPVLNLLLCVVGLPLFVVNLAIMGWAGYKAAKEAGADVLGGAVGGGLAAFIAGTVSAVISVVLSVLGFGVTVATGGDTGSGALGAGMGIVGALIGVVISTGFGLVLGAVGALVAGSSKK